MKTLLVMRHAKSCWKQAELSDHDRPLNKRGKRDAPRMGRLLRQQGLIPDLILSSTAKRARKTVAAVSKNSGFQGKIVTTSDLYHAGLDDFRSALTQAPNNFQSVMIVGHNPGLEILVEELSGKHERFPTGALAYLSLPITRWNDFDIKGDATLVNLWRPRELA